MAIRAFIICALAAHGWGLRTSVEVKETFNSTSTGIKCSGTGYEAMLEKKQIHNKAFPVLGKTTAIIVVDVQQGFTVNGKEQVTDETGKLRRLEGGFAQACLNEDIAQGTDIHTFVIKNIVTAIDKVKEAGGLVVATKDYHPLDHCSFWETKKCQNSPEAANYYAKKANDKYKTNRYINDFPAHCVGTVDGQVNADTDADWKSESEAQFTGHPAAPHVPRQSETMLHPDITVAMKDYPRSHIAYKGLSRDYESFGAFPMTLEPEKNKVGAKLWLDEDGQARKFTDKENPPKSDIDDFLQSPTTDSRKFQALQDFLTKEKITQVLVVGYVYDFCVKETAIGAKQQGFDTTVLTGAARPAGDGIQNKDLSFGLKDPFVPDSGRDQSEKIALGSMEASLKAYDQMRSNNVKQTPALTTPAQSAFDEHIRRHKEAREKARRMNN